MNKLLLLTLAACFAFASNVVAQEGTTAEKESTQSTQDDKAKSSAELFEQYVGEFEEFSRGLSKTAQQAQMKMMNAETEEDKKEATNGLTAMRKKMESETDAIASKMMVLAKAADQDADTSLNAIQWVFSSSDDKTTVKAAADLLIKHHVENENIEEVIASIGQGMPSQARQDIFDKLISDSGNKRISGLASLSMLNYLSSTAQMAPQLEGNEMIAAMYPDLIEYFGTLKDFDEDAITKRYETMAKDYADVKMGDTTIGKMATQKLKAIQIRNQVAVGKVAPDIEGPDIDGANFKLSDYRGKVVMLDFWGDW